MRPLQLQISKTRAIGINLGIWICSAVLACPVGFFSQTMNQYNFTACMVIWPDKKTPDKSTYDFAYDFRILFPQYIFICAFHVMTKYFHIYILYRYNMFFLLITFVIPMAIIGYAYGSMSCKLWGQTYIGMPTESQIVALRSKKRI